jgi:basic membrane protein A
MIRKMNIRGIFMKFKKIISLSLVTVMVGASLVGCSSSNPSEDNTDKKLKVTMISDLGGINDQSFNQSGWEGLQKAGEDFNIDVNVLESKQTSDYTANVETAIEEGADSLSAVQLATKAGAGCGRCSSNVEEITLKLLEEKNN